MSDLGQVRAVVVDAYGTLLDLHGSLLPLVAAHGTAGRALLELWRRKPLEYSWLRSLLQRHADFAVVTAEALDHALAATGIVDAGLRDRLLAACARLEAYPEVPAVLRRLRAAGLVDPVLSVETVKIYKPAPAVHALACDRLRLPAGRIAFLSGNSWDQAGAACFGLQVVAVRRADTIADHLPGEPVAVVRDLAALPPLLGV